jgi:RNA polymerase sigma factor (sigma-70 family)
MPATTAGDGNTDLLRRRFPVKKPAVDRRQVESNCGKGSIDPCSLEIRSGGAGGTEGMWEASDEALLAGFASGDDTAAVAFVRRYQARVFGLASVITRDHSDADEAAQEVFVRAWRYADSFDPRRGSVEKWLLAITRTQCVERLRVSGRLADRQTTGDVLASLPSDDAEVDVTVLERDDVGRVAAAMRTLPGDQAEAVAQATLMGMSAGQISEVKGLPLGTVKTRIRLGLKKLRAALEVQVR